MRIRVWLALAAASSVAGGVALGASEPTAHAARPALVAAQSGQVTTSGLLPPTASTFGAKRFPHWSLLHPSTKPTWTPYASAKVTLAPKVGHAGRGALAVTSHGPGSGARSPTFPVTPGARYTASAWARAKSAAHSVGLVLQFRDATGAIIPDGNQVGQSIAGRRTVWSQTPPVLGFAPPGASTGQVVFVDYDGPRLDVQWVDDVSVQGTTGTAAPLRAPLTTNGPHVVDGLGRLVRLHGVTVEGMENSDHANVTATELAVAQSWGANFLRLPLAENYAVASDCSYDATYLTRVDGLVNAATKAGLFVLLDLHTNALTRCAAPRQQPMPDSEAISFWTSVAHRYASNPLVGFDLYNEPHDVTDAVWHSGGAVSWHGQTYLAVGMQQLYDLVRGLAPDNLIFASGPNWADSYPASDPLTGTTNLVYAVHTYTCPNGPPTTSACTPGPDGTVYDPTGVLGPFTAAAAGQPVMVTEFGFPDTYDSRFITNVVAFAGSHDLVGWDAFAFDNTTSGLFNLWKRAVWPVDPSIAGMAVMTGMLTD